ncbi:hypothetical protein MKW92_008424 [Papaver armeniacum]|nr:hypothetical protein MKW92_008424 [Papaver armeniacum]
MLVIIMKYRSLPRRCVSRIRIELSDAYPYESLLIGFVNKIYHPNFLLFSMSGSTCLDVSNQTWSLMFGYFFRNVFLYPNPLDPLNGEAAALMMRDKAVNEQTQFFFFLPFFTGTSTENLHIPFLDDSYPYNTDKDNSHISHDILTARFTLLSRNLYSSKYLRIFSFLNILL